MTGNWNWVGRYVAVIVLALILAAALGSMDLFKTTAVMGKQLSAANIVKFLGYGAALTVLRKSARSSAGSVAPRSAPEQPPASSYAAG